MKKVINLREIMIILISVVLITVFSTTVFATDLVLGDGTENATVIPGNEYENAQTPTVEENNTTTDISNNITNNNTNTNNTTNNTVNKVTKYNTSDDDEDLPQTGIEDYNVGILLIICVASAIFAYKKINDYKNI